jgi:diphthine synthase
LSGKLFIIGYGLSGPQGLTIQALNILKSVEQIYFEFYTNFVEKETINNLKGIFEKEIIPISRNVLEEDSKTFLQSIENSSTALLISGDPFIATTHHTLWLEAVESGFDVEIINNVSIYSIVPSLTGLSAYKFGKTASITFPENQSIVPYDILRQNLSMNAHSLFLLDIDIKSNKFLDINQALDLLSEMEKKEGQQLIKDDSLILGMAHLGTNKMKIVADTLKNLQKIDWKIIGPPQAIIFPGKLHFAEEDFITKFWKKDSHHAKNFNRPYKKIVITGSFDIIHPGHLQFFLEAKKQLPNAELIVVLARDSSIREFKVRDPILPENHRLSVLKSISLVDKAILGNEGSDKIRIIEEIDADLIVLGYDQWISEEKLKTELAKRNLKAKVLRLGKFGDNLTSSSEIRKRIVTEFSNKTKNNHK